MTRNDSVGRFMCGLIVGVEDLVHFRHCVQFQLTSLTPWCQRSVGPHTRWMQYLKEGHQVCVECQPPALAAGQRHCTGDGEEEESGRQSLQWQAVGNPRCCVVWRRVGRLDSCSCPTVHSFLFI